MAKFKIGDKVRVRLYANSQFRGRVGIVDRLPIKELGRINYTVKIELEDFKTTWQFAEQDLEIVSDK